MLGVQVADALFGGVVAAVDSLTEGPRPSPNLLQRVLQLLSQGQQLRRAASCSRGGILLLVCVQRLHHRAPRRGQHARSRKLPLATLARGKQLLLLLLLLTALQVLLVEVSCSQRLRLLALQPQRLLLLLKGCVLVRRVLESGVRFKSALKRQRRLRLRAHPGATRAW